MEEENGQLGINKQPEITRRKLLKLLGAAGLRGAANSLILKEQAKVAEKAVSWEKLPLRADASLEPLLGQSRFIENFGQDPRVKVIDGERLETGDGSLVFDGENFNPLIRVEIEGATLSPDGRMIFLRTGEVAHKKGAPFEYSLEGSVDLLLLRPEGESSDWQLIKIPKGNQVVFVDKEGESYALLFGVTIKSVCAGYGCNIPEITVIKTNNIDSEEGKQRSFEIYSSSILGRGFEGEIYGEALKRSPELFDMADDWLFYKNWEGGQCAVDRKGGIIASDFSEGFIFTTADGKNSILNFNCIHLISGDLLESSGKANYIAHVTPFDFAQRLSTINGVFVEGSYENAVIVSLSEVRAKEGATADNMEMDKTVKGLVLITVEEGKTVLRVIKEFSAKDKVSSVIRTREGLVLMDGENEVGKIGESKLDQALKSKPLEKPEPQKPIEPPGGFGSGSLVKSYPV